MKKTLSLYIITFAALMFSCNSPAANNAGNADSTIATATDSTTTGTAAPASQPVAGPPAPAAQAQSSTPLPSAQQAEEAADDAPVPEPTEQVTYQKFYDELAPDGTWVNYPGQGRVWQPSVAADFQPYSTNGHWVYSNAGWTWASDYKWGWAAFHYGSWFRDNNQRWLWKPGTQWAPARVTWGQSGGYYGWAPLAPNIAITARWTPPANTWSFVPKEHIDKPEINKYVVNRSTNTTIVKNVTIINNITNNNRTVINNTNSKTILNNNNKTVVNNNIKTVNNANKTVNNKTVVNNSVAINGNKNTVYNKGPQIKEVEKVTNKKVTRLNVANDNRPGPTKVTNNKIVMYRPNVKEAEPKKPEPKKNH